VRLAPRSLREAGRRADTLFALRQIEKVA